MKNTSRTADRNENTSSPLPYILGGVIVAALALIVGFAVLGGGGDKADTNPTASGAIAEKDPLQETAATVQISGTPLVPLAEGSDPALGLVAPTLSGISFDGSAVSSAATGRRAYVFLAHWCPHCQRELPKIVKLQAAGRLAGVSLFAIATNTEKTAANYPPSSWFARENWTNPVLADTADSQAAQAFGLTSFPFIVVVDGEGRVVDRFSGEQPEDVLVARLTGASS